MGEWQKYAPSTVLMCPHGVLFWWDDDRQEWRKRSVGSGMQTCECHPDDVEGGMAV